MRPLVCAFLLFVFLALAKAHVGAQLALFGDEAFYFQCARRLAIAFSDHPFMTAAWVRAGIECLGPTTLGVRAAFQLAGLAFPFLVLWIARPHVGARDAWLAAAASLVVPATAWLGVLAIPDVPLMVCGVLALGCFDRAVRMGKPLWFAAAGLATAAALATHLRAVLVPFAFFCFLVATHAGRAQWKRSGVWVYAATALPGFLPVFLFNLSLDWRPLRFQGQDRHSGGFSLEGLLEHVPLQLAACTPLLYCALVATLVALVRRAARGERGAQLFACFALAHLGVFFLTSPIADTEHATIHWPALGYVPLLVFLPDWLRAFAARDSAPWRRRLAVATPVSGAVILVLAFLELTFHPFRVEALERPFKGYREAADRIASELAARGAELGSPPLVVADFYILAGNLEQQLAARGIAIDLVVLDHAKNHEHGRALQYELWQMDESALARRFAGRDALVIAEKNQSRSSKDKPQSWARWEPRIESHFTRVEPLERLVIQSGGKDPRDFRFWVGRGVMAH